MCGEGQPDGEQREGHPDGDGGDEQDHDRPRVKRSIGLTISTSFSVFMTPPRGDREQRFWMYVDRSQAQTPPANCRRAEVDGGDYLALALRAGAAIETRFRAKLQRLIGACGPGGTFSAVGGG
jgi:hypothetical protein